MSTLRYLKRRHLLGVAASLPMLPLSVAAATPARRVTLDLALAKQPLDRFFDHCVGSDFPGTLFRDDSLGQLKTAVDELGFRYLRFHAIFHDVFKTVTRDEAGKLVFDFTNIDKLYDAMLARRIKPLSSSASRRRRSRPRTTRSSTGRAIPPTPSPRAGAS